MNNNLFPIAKEGWLNIGYAIALFLVLGILDFEFLQFFSFILVLFLLYVYRNPERQIMALEKGGIVSPVDGRISDIKESSDKVEITVESSYNDVSVLRVPISCVVKSIRYLNGASLSKSSKKAEVLNEKLEVVFEDENKNLLEVTHTSMLNFSSISHELIESQKLIQGYRYGLMLKGTTKITLKNPKKLNVSIGNEIKGCESIIAYL
jgi:phosphatidylserine decarboxylase